MNTEKAEIHAKENRKRTVFLIKVVVLVLLAIFSKQIVGYFGDLENFLRALVFFLAGNIVISLARITTVRLYLSKKSHDPIKSNFVLGINRIAEILNVGIFIISFMLLFGTDPLEFFTSITIVAAAIAIVSKDYITNMINGLIIMFSDQLTLGDIIKIGDQEGKITDVTLLNMVLTNEDSDLVMVPNNLLLTAQVINHSKQHIKKLTFEFDMKILPGLDVDAIEEELRKVILKFDKQVNINSFYLKTLAIHKEEVKFKCQFLLNTFKKDLEKQIRREINQTIIKIARQNGEG
ncbi:MAG TPA: mechanosensitive ion channel domain-containing protein [Cyclobacteriaceae bacterium]|nr:mechanosensitive ion channel domain-containing protein [Cyclobacteriaceae bacterium]